MILPFNFRLFVVISFFAIGFSWLHPDLSWPPQSELDEEQQRLELFKRTMPSSIRSFFGDLQIGLKRGVYVSYLLEDMSANYRNIPDGRGLISARQMLSKEFPSKVDQVRALLEWNGKVSGHGPSYETFPTQMLLTYDDKLVLSVIKSSLSSKSRMIGASRYFCDYGFRDKYPYGYSGLDEELKQSIISALTSSVSTKSDLINFQNAMKEWVPSTRFDLNR